MTDTSPLAEDQIDDIDALAAHLHEYATTLDKIHQAQLDQLTGTDVPAMAAEIRRLRARTLTKSEHSAAWHAVEGAASEEGADPGTVLHAVLDRLGITVPGAEEQPAAEDTLPAWLAQRFDPRGPEWNALADDDRTYWEHHAAAVRRAVARGGFKAAEGAQR
jgi:hypothetical protein